MKKVSFILLFMVSFFLMSNLIHAQKKEDRIGIGVSIGKEITFEEGTFTLLDFPSFYVTLIGFSYFRVEPEIGYYRYSSSDENLKSSHEILSVGCGFFYAIRKEKVDVYFGMRLGVIQTSSYFKSPLDEWDRSKIDFYIGPALGGEYLFTKRFSLGGEIQLNFISIGQWDGDLSAENSESVVRTKPLIFVRWYF